jgi:hypothetical protein
VGEGDCPEVIVLFRWYAAILKELLNAKISSEGEREQDEQAEAAEIQAADTRSERVRWRSVG